MTKSVTNKTTPAPELDDIMLAMDVVDTLRYHQTVVDRELEAADYDEALAAQVMKTYADQGLAVSPEVVAEAVKALREERFAYQPPKTGFQLFLARCYVKRGPWFKILVFAVLLVVGLLGSYQWFWVRPAIKARQLQTQRLEQAWSAFQQSQPPSEMVGHATRVYEQGKAALAQGEGGAFDAHLATLEGLAILPERLTRALKQVTAAAKEPGVGQKAQTLYGDGLQALTAGNIRAGRQALQSLEHMQTLLSQAYTLRIVSRPGVPSGVWRVPPNNPNARNFYLIVEAVTAEGKSLTLPITSEEDQKTRRVDMWGLRVSPETYDQIRRDKSDDGIIQNSRMGIKQRGYLTPEYLIPTTGGAITDWENRV